MERRRVKRFRTVCALSMLLCLAAAGCGRSGQTEKDADAGGNLTVVSTVREEQAQQYEIETLEIEAQPAMKQAGENLYYVAGSYDQKEEMFFQSIYKYSLSEGRKEKLPAVIDGSPMRFEIGEDGSIYAVVVNWEEGTAYRLEKYDASGGQIYSRDIQKWADTGNAGNDGYLVNVLAEKEGGVCLVFDKKVFLFDQEGEFVCSVDPLSGKTDDMANAIRSAGRGKDGTIYVCISDENWKCSLAEIDFAQKKARTVVEEFPSISSYGLNPGIEKDLLVSDGSAVYEYDLTEMTRNSLFAWSDIGLNGDQIQSVGAVSDGNFLAIQYNWSTQKGNVLLLKRVSAGEKPMKEELVLATVSDVTVLKQAVAEFNRKSDKYHITVKKYLDGEWSIEAADEARTKFNLEMAAGNVPDIIDMDFLYTDILAKQGYLEDLAPYLERSAVIGRDDFVGNILDTCTINGKLVYLPKQFTISAAVGHISDVGEDIGWTVEEVMEMAEKHPGAQILGQPGKSNLLYFCIVHNLDTYVDRNAGKCSFDTPEFIRLLEFADRYGGIEAGGSDTGSYEKSQRGEILLLEGYFDTLDRIQIYQEIFEGEACVVGYPTADGSAACELWTNAMCGIPVSSAHKEGAWEFLESFVTAENSEYMYAFPALKTRLEKQMQGELAREGEKEIGYSGNFNITIGPPTQEEADQMMEIICTAVARNYDAEIGKIIFEEADVFFQGSKPAAETADVIQRRVQLYLDENQ